MSIFSIKASTPVFLLDHLLSSSYTRKSSLISQARNRKEHRTLVPPTTSDKDLWNLSSVISFEASVVITIVPNNYFSPTSTVCR